MSTPDPIVKALDAPGLAIDVVGMVVAAAAPNETEADPTRRDASRLFRYDERCPVCGSATRYALATKPTVYEYQTFLKDGPVTFDGGPYVALECVNCSWSEIRC